MFEQIIGFEIHVELKTKSKMFCGCKNDPFHAPNPNIYTCPVCLGLPGALPVPNKKAVEWAMMLGLALGCEIPEVSKFDRKHYFYPDLPKGYQISQYDQPLAHNGELTIDMSFPRTRESSGFKLDPRVPSERLRVNGPEDDKGHDKTIRIRRVHLEEDTGKLYHQKVDGKPVTLIDFNRSGVPLVEIVTEPDIRNGEEATVFLKRLHQIIRYLDISDADMEKGSMRLEPNISVRASVRQRVSDENELPKYKVEVKNINSFRFVRRAIEYEVNRQIAVLEKGETPTQETRGWDEDKGITYTQRHKEEAEDYRYFPEPDIPPMRWQPSVISRQLSAIPEMPDKKKQRFMKKYGLGDYDAELLTESRGLAEFYEAAISHLSSAIRKTKITPKTIANWIINKKVDPKTKKPEELIAEIVKATTVEDVAEDTISQMIALVLEQNTKAVADFKSGKEQSFMFLFGQALRQLQGKGDKKKIQEALRAKLTQ